MTMRWLIQYLTKQHCSNMREVVSSVGVQGSMRSRAIRLLLAVLSRSATRHDGSSV